MFSVIKLNFSYGKIYLFKRIKKNQKFIYIFKRKIIFIFQVKLLIKKKTILAQNTDKILRKVFSAG